ncbi:MAG TPA: nitronate monooxygenase [Syntrophomonadaceae bacterium]|nr:nitronate monooxygenase [Syntrophomonadaceae bacterium]HPU48220.1 nitronate monooxygenase [Syntrophomonadaceae bacterium]
MKTRITELFGIEYPIICGGMLWLATPELCAAISNAGGLGNITACNYDTGEELRQAIQRARELTSKPIGVNITLMPSMRFTDEIFDDFFKVCAEEKVEVIEVSGRPAVKYLDMLHKAGVKVMHKVGAVRHAKNIERYGYDAVIAAGIEEGGHPLNDDVTTMVLVPRIVESVSIPVIATGGIADGRGLAAALALGAEGVLMATRFIATKECAVHPRVWEELIQRQEHETTLICKTVGLQGRALKNKLAEQVLELESKGASLADLVPLLSGQKAKTAWQTGEVDDAALMVGQSIGLVKEVTTCKELIESMVEEARTILANNLARFNN